MIRGTHARERDAKGAAAGIERAAGEIAKNVVAGKIEGGSELLPEKAIGNETETEIGDDCRPLRGRGDTDDSEVGETHEREAGGRCGMRNERWWSWRIEARHRRLCQDFRCFDHLRASPRIPDSRAHGRPGDPRPQPSLA